MQEIVLRMRRVSEDLREIGKRLEQLRNSRNMDERQVVDEVLQLDLIREFKSSLDQIRMFLWEYFQEACTRYEAAPEHCVEEFRLRRATEMLRSVQDDITIPIVQDHIEVKSLFERLQQLADVTVERHFATKKGRDA
jgi:hypothetical protein